jgi:O-antigen/teichoic acid export membrane protein
MRGRWSFAAAQASWVQSQAYIYITTAMLNLEALAALAAARMLVAPLATALAAWAKAALPRLAESAAHTRLAAAWRSSAAFLGLVALWETALLLAGDLVAERLFLGKYPQIAELTLLWAIVMAANGFRTIMMTALRAGGHFTALTRASTAGAIATVMLCPLGVLVLAGKGALLALAAVEFAIGLLFVMLLRRRSAPPQGAA